MKKILILLCIGLSSCNNPKGVEEREAPEFKNTIQMEILQQGNFSTRICKFKVDSSEYIIAQYGESLAIVKHK